MVFFSHVTKCPAQLKMFPSLRKTIFLDAYNIRESMYYLYFSLKPLSMNLLKIQYEKCLHLLECMQHHLEQGMWKNIVEKGFPCQPDHVSLIEQVPTCILQYTCILLVHDCVSSSPLRASTRIFPKFFAIFHTKSVQKIKIPNLKA